MKRNAYLAEFAATAAMVGFGLLVVGFFWSSASPAANLMVGDGLRRLITGFFFAGGATVVIYSPLGRISGGHINPSVTLAFLALRKISARDSVIYVLSQLAGGIAGTMIPWIVLVQWAGWTDAIIIGVTRPGPGFPLSMVIATEIGITAVLMLVILVVSNRPRFSRLTPVLAGSIVMVGVWAAAHVSGTSLNEARSLAPALYTGVWADHWLYVIAPIVGAQIAVGIYRAVPWGRRVLCCKLIHDDAYPCHFEACEYGHR